MKHLDRREFLQTTGAAAVASAVGGHFGGRLAEAGEDVGFIVRGEPT